MQTGEIYEQYMYSYPHKTAYGALADIHLKDYLGRLAGKENSLYFHIPFCQHKCGYCNLFSVTGQPEQRMRDYVDAMERHAAQLSAELPAGAEFTDLTFGGGTPLVLPEPLLYRVLSLAGKYFGFEADGHSVAVETSPNQTTEEKLDLLKEAGVGRISIGVQSFREEELHTLRRFHSVESAKRALALIKKMDFDCVNVDLIYGIPGQTADSLLDSLKWAVEFEPEELFVYPLYVKPGTFLFRQGVERTPDTPKLYRLVRDFLRGAGYRQHSMRRFVKGRKQTQTLCGFGNTLSVGCGGRSYLGRLHFCTPYAVKRERCLAVLDEYIRQEDYLKVTHGFLLSMEEEKRRYVIRHILFGRGIDRGDYRMHFGEEVQDAFPQIMEWAASGYAIIGDDYITLTDEGAALSDYLGPQLISDAVRKKSAMFYRNDAIGNV